MARTFDSAKVIYHCKSLLYYRLLKRASIMKQFFVSIAKFRAEREIIHCIFHQFAEDDRLALVNVTWSVPEPLYHLVSITINQ